MKICRKNTITFGEVKTGEVFKEADGTIAMKIISIDYDWEGGNAVDLETGESYICNENTSVEILNAELIY